MHARSREGFLHQVHVQFGFSVMPCRNMFCSAHAAEPRDGGVNRDRTGDLKLAKLALSQLSYDPGLAADNLRCFAT
jgi:hypothetical protein